MIVSIAKNLYTNELHETSVDKALERIATGRSKELITELRSMDKSERGRVKKNLPIVLFSGRFTGRKDELLKEHSGYVVLDFDNLENVNQVKQSIGSDKYVYACWVSPSGNGLKALVKVTNPERHRDHFRSLTSYFDKQYGLEVDPSGVNESRACFESYDPDIIVNSTYDKFGGMLSEKSQNQEMSHQEVVTDYMKLNLAARMVRDSREGERHPILFKAARLCGGYIAAGRMEEDEAKRVLLREFSRIPYDEHYSPEKTILDGIDVGKNMPISELVRDEKELKRQMQIKEGDMSFISSGDADFKWIQDFANGVIEVGLDTGNDILDKHFRYKKDFTIINGHSNVGKTTFLLFLLVTSARLHKWRWLIYSSENRTASIKVRLMQFLMDEPIDRMSYDKRKVAFEWVNDHFTFIDNKKVLSYFDLLVYCEQIRKQQHIDGFFIDPYNSLRVDLTSQQKGVHQYHYEAASEFLTYANTNSVAVYLNTHAVTEAQRRKDSQGYSAPPYAEDTEGGGLFVNRCDDFMTVHRVIQHEDPAVRRTTQLHIRKIRETETGGQPTPLFEPIKFEMNSTRTFFRPIIGSSLFDPINYSDIKQAQIPVDMSIDLTSIF